MALAILGIDMGKREFHCALSVEEIVRNKHFPNSKVGFSQLHRWLRNRGVDRVHVCLEATGGWSEELAADLHEHGHIVSLVNPLAIKAFGQSELSRTKTDKADAELIARFCAAMGPEPWQPPSPTQRRLQQLARRRMALDDMRTQEKNRLEGPAIGVVVDSIKTTLEFLSEQIDEIDAQMRRLIDEDPTLRGRRDLLESIPGVGERVAVTILGELPNIHEFRSGKAVAAFAGLCPREFRSGTSVSASWLSRRGNVHLRRILYMPAIVAMRCNPMLKAFAVRLRASGKRGKQVVAAVMRRLLVLAYGVLKSGRPFDPRFGCGRRHSRRSVALVKGHRKALPA
jgi:transposase